MSFFVGWCCTLREETFFVLTSLKEFLGAVQFTPRRKAFGVYITFCEIIADWLYTAGKNL